MKILMLTAEAAPFVRVGGLSQVVYFLSRQLVALGHDVRVFMPKYGVIKPQFKSKLVYQSLDVPFGKLHRNQVLCNIRTARRRKKCAFTYFLENREYYELRANVFAYRDDHLRFFLLSRGCLEWLLLQQSSRDGWVPDLVHCHDWHTGYFVDEARRNPRYLSAVAKIPILYTVHNFKYQGNTGFKHLPPAKQDNGKRSLNVNQERKLLTQNPLLRGMLYADWVSTVSRSHVLEVMTAEYGEGLEKYLTKIRGKFSGILNGLDNKEFNPSTDPFIKRNFSATSLERRVSNKLELQRTFGLPKNERVFMCGFVGRLSKQKGIGLLMQAVRKILEEYQMQLVVLGGGESDYKNQLAKLQKSFPQHVSVHLYPDFKLPRKIFAGVDATLIPSAFEPGGIVALESMRYGAVPIVRKTGGLADSVEDFNPQTKTGNGFVFAQSSQWSLFATLVRALTIYQQPALWKRVVTGAMKSDFSWKTTASQYDLLYRQVVRQRKRFLSTNPHLAYDPLHKG
jgi:starch synthase